MRHALLPVPAWPRPGGPWPVAATLLLPVLLHLQAPAAHEAPAGGLLEACLAAACHTGLAAVAWLA
jgi:hypothetical protein